MAFLTLSNGTTTLDVPVAEGGCDEELVEIGDRLQAFDGTPRATITARKRVWNVSQTALRTGTEVATLRSLLLSQPTLSASGDWIGGIVTVWPIVGKRVPMNTSPVTYQLAFTLKEA